MVNNPKLFWGFLGLYTMLFLAPVLAQNSFTDPLPKDPKIRIGQLENGLTFIIRENKMPEKKVDLGGPFL